MPTMMELGQERSRVRKGAVRPEITPAEIRGLLADVATAGGVPFVDAAQQAQQGNYGQAAVSGLLDAPPVKMAGIALAPLITAFHGSPYKFSKFDISKLGTGEGAQAYGHGMYFAESPQVAAQYQRNVSRSKFAEGKLGQVDKIGNKPVEKVYEELQRRADRLPVKKAQVEYEKLAFLEDLMQQPSFDDALKRIDNDEILPWAKSLQSKWNPAGSLYKVDIPDEAVARMINWDKPLGEQPKAVIDALESMRDVPELSSLWSFTGRMRTTDLPGEYAMERLRKAYPNPQELASILSQKGVSGVKYLDQGSRFAGRGTQNFVVFDPEIVKILERNNQPIGLLE